MKLHILKPKKALNKAFLKIKPIRSEIEIFKKNLIDLIDNSNDVESEEFHKNLVADFLKRTYYDPNYFINTKGRNDLVIHNGSKANTPVGVILETKKPTNSSEMISAERTNTKALQELVLYYLRERITGKNLEIKNLIVTNIYEWYIFNANDFEKYFAQNKSLVKQFIDFENGSLSGTSTDFFYKEIAAPAIEAIQAEVECTYFDFRKFNKVLRNTDLKDDVKLVALFKLLSPEHLLKKPFANDSNTLDGKFYKELLHIIGLSEQKQGSKKVIERNPIGERNTGALLEDAIIQIDSMDRLSRMDRPSQYGDTQEERLFNVGLELAITWINRVLFLKLLEAQLIAYHEGDKKYAFLNYQRISSYDDLNSLFFQVLAKKHNERNADVLKAFENVPYLNSSLFEPTEIEHEALFISNLRDDKTLSILDGTVLKDAKGKRRKGEITTLQYLFDFLNSYDFSGEGAENIQEDNKTLINASVLGLIFEKINGYKDGSFFTPGFITMYMCRETIRKAIVQKFNEASETEENENKYQSITDIYNAIGSRGEFSHQEANALINDVKICDPAVGSGHFLVSALNEMIAVKHDLGVLHDRSGKLLRDYDVLVENDELIITDYNGELFEYHPQSLESQRVQETLFHEKQTIIENCLFGVDINPNSVKICRLRLWIELLKNAYYKNATELETLPNIDINIKCGNSLISRFDLDADLGKALRSSKWNMDSYRIAVQTYRNAENKEQKHEMERLIADIKGDFKTEISRHSKEQRDYDRESAKLYEKHMAPKLFEEELSRAQKSKLKKEREKLEAKVIKLKEQLDEIKNNKIYENAFEWRFEFPEVLDDDGGFVGFDVVIGNPPYFLISSDPSLKGVKNKYKTFSSSSDIYTLFVEQAINILRSKGLTSLIISNKWLRAGYGESLREFISKETKPIELIDFGQNLLFDSAIVHTSIISLEKGLPDQEINAVRFIDKAFDNDNFDFEKFIDENIIKNVKVSEDIWNVIPKNLSLLKERIENKFKKLMNWEIDFYRGVLTGYNKAFIIESEKRNEIISQDEKNDELIKPILRGRDTRRYYSNFPDLWLISTFPSKNINIDEYLGIKEYLKSFGKRIEQTGGDGARKKTNNKWFETQDSISYWEFFEKPKIIFSEIVSEPQFYYDEKGYYPEATVFFISGKKLKYLTALLNSKAATFFFKTFYMGGELVGKIRYKKAFLEQLPIPYPTENEEIEVVKLVDKILTAKQEDPSIDTSALENEIDVLVYRLYGLTYEEVKVVDEGFWMSEEEYINRVENESGE